MPTPRYVCVHGHFYQPPRENPWLEAIELQDSAYPYHDWNERITDESYRQNARSRILDEEAWIVKIVNNYSRISFNFGPTVLSWFHAHAPDVHEAIVEADLRSMERFSGHGSALAQAYNHSILPLCNDRDLRTQIIWGLRDFEHRFGRKAEGMWMPETAANAATLEALAEQGVKFTLLAPRQAARIRPRRGGRWRDLQGDVDPSRAYVARLPSGRSIALFFYDGPISQAVAFEGLLNSGNTFANRLMSGFHDQRQWAQLVHIATDGESYGHHHRHGDMALAAALELIEENPDVRLTNYGEYLERHPPAYMVEIVEDSSWSCIHGIGRWREDCGCHTGGHSDWNQQWRTPLREALNWLRDTLIGRYEEAAGALLRDPWAARDEYIEVILDRSPDHVRGWIAQHAQQELSDEQKSRILKLMELQRHAMLMYTSCGWFFDELSGLETVQVIQYAGRVVQLAHDLFGPVIEDGFRDRLSRAHSNIPEQGDGRMIYDRYVKTTAVDLPKVGGHYAISSLFDEDDERQSRIYCYDVELEDTHERSAGQARMHVGRARLTSEITWESARLAFMALHLGEHVVNGAVRPFQDMQRYEEMVNGVTEAFNRADFTVLLRMMDDAFGPASYTLASLFRDEQRRVLNIILESTLGHVESGYRQMYERYAPLMRFLGGLHIPSPGALNLAAQFIINADLRDSFAADPPDVERIRSLLREADDQKLALDEVTLSFAAEHAVEQLTARLAESGHERRLLEHLRDLIGVQQELPFEVEVLELQNVLYEMLHTHRPQHASAAEGGDEEAGQWLNLFDELAGMLKVRIDGHGEKMMQRDEQVVTG